MYDEVIARLEASAIRAAGLSVPRSWEGEAAAPTIARIGSGLPRVIAALLQTQMQELYHLHQCLYKQLELAYQ